MRGFIALRPLHRRVGPRWLRLFILSSLIRLCINLLLMRLPAVSKRGEYVMDSETDGDNSCDGTPGPLVCLVD